MDDTRKDPRATRPRPPAAALAALAAAVIALTTLPAAVPAAAAPPDWNLEADPLQAAVGVHVGKLGGTGLAFRGPLKWWFLQVQVAGGIWNSSDHKRHNVGGEVNFLLRQDPRLRLYLLGGLGYTYHRERLVDADGAERWETRTHTNVGAGVGIEYLLSRRWSLKVDLDFTHEGSDGDVMLWPQAGLFFYW